MSVFSALERWRQENEFKATLNYTASLKSALTTQYPNPNLNKRKKKYKSKTKVYNYLNLQQGMFRLRNDFALINQLLAFILYMCGAHVCAPMCLGAQVCNCTWMDCSRIPYNVCSIY